VDQAVGAKLITKPKVKSPKAVERGKARIASMLPEEVGI